MNNNWVGKRVLIIGAARQGLALARYLLSKDALVTVNDQHTAEQLQSAIEGLSHANLRWELGAHPLSLLDQTDLVCISGGVPLTLPILVEAVKRGIPLSNDSQIFMEACPAPVIAITGSAGKTTTTTLVGRMAQHAAGNSHKAFVGGNIGLPLVEYLDEIKADDLVVLELSSFQLEQMTISAHVAAVLNITPNHLDRHGTMEAYTAAKARVLQFQQTGDIAILNRDDAGSMALLPMVKGRTVTFGFDRPEKNQTGTFVANNKVYWMENGKETEILPVNLIRLRGQHMLATVLAACAIAFTAGFSIEDMLAGVSGFTGVAHRMELVRVWHGIQWYNDSIATAPERVSAAIRAFNEPIVLLLGGRDKNLPWQDLSELVHERVDHVILFGEAAEKIAASLGDVSSEQRPFTIQRCTVLKDAVQAASQVAQPGDVVLLSPGGTSYDEFKDFEERGEVYRQWVNQLS